MDYGARIESKIEVIQQDISEINKTIAVNTVSLQEHMRRTDAIEKRLDSIPAKALTLITLLSGIAALLKLIIT